MAEHAIASRLNIDRRTVARWKQRWFENASALMEHDKELFGVEYERAVLSTFNDPPVGAVLVNLPQSKFAKSSMFPVNRRVKVMFQ